MLLRENGSMEEVFKATHTACVQRIKAWAFQNRAFIRVLPMQ